MSSSDLIHLYHQAVTAGTHDLPTLVLTRLLNSLGAPGGKLLWQGEILVAQGNCNGVMKRYPLPAGRDTFQLFLAGGVEPAAELLSTAGMVLVAWQLQEELRQARMSERRRLWEVEALRTMAETLGGTLDWQAATQLALFQSMALLDARRGEVWLGQQFPWPGSSWDRLQGDFFLGAREGEEVLSPQRVVSVPPEGLVTERVLAVPIRGRHRVLGILALGDREVRGGVTPFTKPDMETLSLLAIQMGLALEAILAFGSRLEKEKLEQELSLAAAVQRQLLPTLPRKIPGWDLVSYFSPSRQMGGDLYDLVSTPGGIVLALFDVAGKGTPAALLAATLQGALRVVASQTQDLAALAATLDRVLATLWAPHQFTTAMFWQLREHGLVRYLGAGHTPAVVIGTQGIKVFPAQCPPLGLLDRAAFNQSELHLEIGDTVMLATDGFVEAESSEGEELGLERLKEAAWDGRDKSLSELVTHLVACLQQHTGPRQPHDDRTLVIFRRTE